MIFPHLAPQVEPVTYGDGVCRLFSSFRRMVALSFAQDFNYKVFDAITEPGFLMTPHELVYTLF